MSNRVLISIIKREFYPGYDEKRQAVFVKYLSAIISRQMLKIQQLTVFFPLKQQYLVFERFQKRSLFCRFPAFLLSTISCGQFFFEYWFIIQLFKFSKLSNSLTISTTYLISAQIGFTHLRQNSG